MSRVGRVGVLDRMTVFDGRSAARVMGACFTGAEINGGSEVGGWVDAGGDGVHAITAACPHCTRVHMPAVLGRDMSSAVTSTEQSR